MKRKYKIKLLISIFLLSLLSSCSQEKVRVKGYVYDVELLPMRRGNKRVAMYQFSFQDSIYTRAYEYTKVSRWHYLTGDSIWVTIPNNRPDKSKPDTIFYRPQQEKELAIPAIDSDNRIVTYRSIAEKPLFFVSDEPENNKEKMREYIERKKVENMIFTPGIVGVDIIISKNGKIEEVELLRSSGNNELDSFVVKTLLSLPAGKPGIDKDGEPERVGLIMEFDFR